LLKTTELIRKGTPAFRRTTLAVFAAGFSTFALLYCVQPLMPVFSREFHVSPAASSLSVSLTAGLLAVSILIAGSISDAWGRKSVMVFSLAAAAALTVVSALMPGWRGFLTVRALEGVAFSGLPAVAMAYLSEEIHPGSVGLAMGIYIGGGALGGMAGRFTAGILTDLLSWRWALGAIGGFGVVAAFVFWRALPASVHFDPRPLELRRAVAAFLDHLRDAGLPWIFAEGFLLLGSFTTIYNYIGYRLLAPPYELSQTAVGAVFGVYVVGIGSSAWVGDLAGRLGRRKVMWATMTVMLAGLAVTLARPLVVVIAGLVIFTFGFFGSHSVASSWVGLRARHSKAQASALYLFFYYLGSSVLGAYGGFFWSAWAWRGIVAFIGGLLVVGLLISLRLASVQPLSRDAGAVAPVP
jgi:MFS transporter, YNFM family, putative membrane transport protein